jgi:hypothetical protein
MNNELVKIIKSNNIHPVAYQKIGKVYFIKDQNHTYVIKLNTNNYDIYKYLMSRKFINIPQNYSLKHANYDMYEYIENISEKKNQKIDYLITILSILHKKSAYMREIDLDEYYYFL